MTGSTFPDSASATPAPGTANCTALVDNLGHLNQQQTSTIVGSCVSEEAIARSGLLSGVSHTAGLAALPSQLSLEDLKLWETAYIVETELLPDELTTVLKVADALGDAPENIDKWATKLADKAVHTFQHSTVQPAAPDQDDVLACLLSLPPHVLSNILSKCLSTLSLGSILSSFPAPLHPQITSAAAATGSMVLTHFPTTVLTHLPYATLANPGLQALTFVPEDPSPPSTGALLARAATAHPTLTTLNLTAVLSPQWLRRFSEGLAPGALRNLGDLSIRIDAHPGGCAEVAACLARLPLLTSLKVKLSLNLPAPATVPLSAYTRLAASPAILPHLQHLHYGEQRKIVHSDAGQPDPSGQLMSGGVRQSLQCTSAHSVLSVLTAPALQTLTLDLDWGRIPLHTLLPHIARFTALTCIYMRAACTKSRCSSKEEAAPAGHLPALAKLSVEGGCCASAPTLAAGIARMAASSLTALSICIGDDVHPQDDPPSPEDELSARLLAFRAIARCTALRDLQMDSLLGVSSYRRDSVSSALAAALLPLTQLSHLSMQPWDIQTVPVRLSGSLLGGALSTLTALENLAFYGAADGFEFDSMEPVAAACQQLSRLTSLDIQFCGFTLQHATSVLEHLPAMQDLNVRVSVAAGGEFDAARGWGEAELIALVAEFSDVNITVL